MLQEKFIGEKDPMQVVDSDEKQENSQMKIVDQAPQE